ncbi:MAG: zinc metallopeptidase [Bacteroidia bacterium]|nr:zinc metallopeptidase [Bacteroidia bacterium]MCZ2140704.1 zinc metallopeptidase [Bacteroidia bacterium]
MFLLFIAFFGISLLVSYRFKNKIKKYSEATLFQSLTGAEIAEKMLQDNGIYDVKVISAEGQLTDHYNPMNKTVNLSYEVYHGRTVAAAAIAAHECGHAVQHAQAYPFLKFRSAMVPIQNVSARLLNIIVLVMMFGGYFLFRSSFSFEFVAIVLIACQSVITLFSLVTLPVEFDASKRGLAWLTNKGIVLDSEHDMAKDALKWAAMTYVVAALGAIATLLYYIMLFTGRRD